MARGLSSMASRVMALLATLVAAAAAAVAAEPGPLAGATLEWRAFRTFTSADGLPENGALRLLQGRSGAIYAGTRHGLARYDGRDWSALPLPGLEPGYAVGALLEASDGALWIGTDQAGFWRGQDGAFQRLALPVEAAATAMLEWPAGTLWLGSMRGLWRCAGTVCTEVTALSGTGIRSLLPVRGATPPALWVGSHGEGLRRLEDLDREQPRLATWRLGRAQGLPNEVVMSLAEFAGALWIGAGRGLARWDGSRVTAYGPREGFPEAMVFDLLAAPDGSLLYAALRPGGLVEIDPDGHWRRIDARLGLPGNAAQALLLDRQRMRLWVATADAGVARHERDRWMLFDESIGLPGRAIQGVGWLAGDAVLWVGTALGAVRWQDGRFLPLLPAGQPALQVNAVIDAPDGTRWVAHSRGLQRWQGERLLEAFHADDSALPGVAVHALALRHLQDGDFELYAGTAHGLTRWRPQEGLVALGEVAGIGADADALRLLVLVAARPGGSERLLALRGGRLTLLDEAGWRQEGTCLTAPAVDVELEPDASRTRFWVLSRSALTELDAEGRCRAWPAVTGLGALSHLRRAGPWLYVFGARGALRLDPRGDPAQAGRRYDAADGLAPADVRASAVDPRGRLFLATPGGLAALDPGGHESFPPAELRLVSASYGERLLPLQDGAILRPRDSSVAFRYALLAFEREHAHRYRFRLDGLDSGPGPWSASGDVAYARLPPGRYRLRVEAVDADGMAALPADFRFEVAPFWWQRPWSLMALAALLVGLGASIGRWRSLALQRRARALEGLVAARTRELREANAQLERASITDPLTGLYNRRFFAHVAEAEAARARRGAATQALLVILLDIDHFKAINDRHGHEAGDAVLVEVGARLRRAARAGDMLLRWGGEEFLLLLRDVAREGAAEQLRRMLEAVSAAPIRVGPSALEVTLSGGAVLYPSRPEPESGEGLGDCLIRADALLYQAKREGRDRGFIALRGDAPPARVRPAGRG